MTLCFFFYMYTAIYNTHGALWAPEWSPPLVCRDTEIQRKGNKREKKLVYYLSPPAGPPSYTVGDQVEQQFGSKAFKITVKSGKLRPLKLSELTNKSQF